MLNKFNEVKSVGYSSDSTMSVNIDFEDVEVFEVRSSNWIMGFNIERVLSQL